ncbi:N-acetylglucosamine-6-phosphate deacetylase [Eubacteriales bacterium OttesenSCG-928-M02]|nr:N-acetylglucosamine-6-phosphate deacetylase [Eubacteriales bacterium OttesenSCG-928-M02]
MVKALKAKRVMDGYRSIPDGVVVIRDGKIDGVGPASRTPIPSDAEVVDYGDKIIAPGLVDIHIHGCKGNGTNEAVENIYDCAAYVLKAGYTSWLPTLNSTQGAAYAAEAIRTQKAEGYKGARIAGVHLEGPFQSPKNIPGMPEVDAHLLPPTVEKFNEIYDASEGNMKIMGLGPDQPGAYDVIRRMRELGVVPACAHSKMGYDEMMQAYENGLTHGTHLYNVMTGLHHRRPGITGALMSFDGFTTELICDGLHVHPAALEVAIRCKGIDRIAMISDHGIGGLPDGEYTRSNGRTVVVKDGICRLKGSDPSQDNTMAGSCFLMDRGIYNVYKVLNRPLEDAIRMATITPAKIIHIDDYTGSLEVGKCADIMVMDDDIVVYETIVEGKTLYTKA